MREIGSTYKYYTQDKNLSTPIYLGGDPTKEAWKSVVRVTGKEERLLIKGPLLSWLLLGQLELIPLGILWGTVQMPLELSLWRTFISQVQSLGADSGPWALMPLCFWPALCMSRAHSEKALSRQTEKHLKWDTVSMQRKCPLGELFIVTAAETRDSTKGVCYNM